MPVLNNQLGGCSLAHEGNDFYIVGADSVRKKLGSPIFRDYTLTSNGWDGAKTITFPEKHPSYPNAVYVGIVSFVFNNTDIQYPSMSLSGRNLNFRNDCGPTTVTARYMEA